MKPWTSEELYEKEKLYIKNKGVKCPFCKSSQIEGDDVDINTGIASQEMGCLECEAIWWDIYKLNTIHVTKLPEKYDVALIRLRNSLKLSN
jgi:hypothetical protein